MMQAAKSWHRYDSAAGFGILLSLTSGRCSLRQREMGPVFVIIANVLPHQAFQMPLIQNNYMVKQIASAVADPALGHAVLPRTAEAGPLGLDPSSWALSTRESLDGQTERNIFAFQLLVYS